MAGFLRSRLTIRSDAPGHVPLPIVSQPQSKDTNHTKGSTSPLIYRYRTAIVLLSSILLWNYIFASEKGESILPQAKAPMGDIIYGAKSKGEDTASLVKEAIQTGFRHIATVRDDNIILFSHIDNVVSQNLLSFRVDSTLNTMKQGSVEAGWKVEYHATNCTCRLSLSLNQPKIMENKIAYLRQYVHRYLV